MSKNIDQTVEQWLAIPGWEGRYEVSDLGRVRSLPRCSRDSTLMLSTFPAKRGGYLSVGLTRGDVTRVHPVHKLVALAFLGPRPAGMEVRHLDSDPLNPSLRNLEYGTSSQNKLDQVARGTHPQASKTHCPSNHPYDAVNTYVNPSSGRRACRTCGRESSRAFYAQHGRRKASP